MSFYNLIKFTSRYPLLSCNSKNLVFRSYLKTSLPQFAVRKKRSIWYIFRVWRINAITTTLSYTFRGFQQQLFKITRMIKVQVMQNIMFLNYSSSKIAKNRIFNQSSLSRVLQNVFSLLLLFLEVEKWLPKICSYKILLTGVDFVNNFFP